MPELSDGFPGRVFKCEICRVCDYFWYIDSEVREWYCNLLISISLGSVRLWSTHSHHPPRGWKSSVQFSSVTQSCPTLRLHWLQIAKAPCPSPTPGVYSNSCPLNQWCHPMSHPLSSPSPPIFNLSQHQGLLKMSQLFSTGGQSTGVSTSASILPMNTQDWSPLGWTGWISLQSKGLSSVFFSTTVQSINYSALSFLYSPPLTSIHEYWKSHSLD